MTNPKPPQNNKAITIAVRTEGVEPTVESFIKNLYSNLEEQYAPTVVCIDDGTAEKDIVTARADFCQRWNVKFIHSEQRIGEFACWEQIVAQFPADITIFFSDADRITCPGWLHRMVHFLENNSVDVVALPLLEELSYKDNDKQWHRDPLTLYAPSTAFAIRDDLLGNVFNHSNKRFVLPWPPVYTQQQVHLTADCEYELVWLDKMGKETTNRRQEST